MIVYLLDLTRPTRRIRRVEAELLQGGWTWARYQDRRYLLGSSAFYTWAAAARAKAGLLLKIVRCDFLRWRHAHFYERAVQQLKSYQVGGTDL